jgi:uncharacterized OB-fold protein
MPTSQGGPSDGRPSQPATPPPPLLRSGPVTPVREGLFTEGAEPHLIGASCATCGRQHFPRTDTCPYCGADTVSACELPSTGRLWAWTTVTAPPPGYAGPVPYGFGVVELGECIRVVTRLTVPDAAALHAGQAMRLVLDDVGDAGQGPLLSWAFAPEAS